MYKRILCATDLDEGSAEAVKQTVQLAHQFNSTIVMLNIHEEFMTKDEMRMLRVSIDTMKSQFEKTALKAKKEMREEIISLHAEDIEVEYIIRDGRPDKAICEEAKKAQADLVIMGVNDKSVSNIIFRSTASFVIEHVKIPVLVMPIKSK